MSCKLSFEKQASSNFFVVGGVGWKKGVGGGVRTLFVWTCGSQGLAQSLSFENLGACRAFFLFFQKTRTFGAVVVPVGV